MTGAFLLLAGLGWAGWSAGRDLARQTALLRELMDGLARMEREMSFRLTPMPDLLDLIGQEAAPPLDCFFARCAQCARGGEVPFGEGWQEAAEMLEGNLDPAAISCILRLGRGLGRCDSEGESRLLGLALTELGDILKRAEKESHSRGRLYSVLGLTAGAFLVILLI